MIDVCLARFFSCLTYSNLLRFPFFMKLAHRHLFAVLFSFQRTIALSDLISLSRHFSFVKQIFLFFLCFFRAVYRLTDGGYYPTILFTFCQADFFRFYRYFRFFSHLFFVSAHTCPFRRLRRHLPRQAGTAFLSESFLYFSIWLIQKQHVIPVFSAWILHFVQE